MHRRRRGGAGGGVEAPLNENLGGRGSAPTFRSRGRKLVWQNIPVSDLFTNRVTMVTLGEILFSRTL